MHVFVCENDQVCVWVCVCLCVRMIECAYVRVLELVRVCASQCVCVLEKECFSCARMHNPDKQVCEV